MAQALNVYYCQKTQFIRSMNGITKITKGVSAAMACALLMAFSSPVLEPIKINTEPDDDPLQVEEVIFGEDCLTCRYVTIYDENDKLIYDKLVLDSENIKDAKLSGILEKSYFLMSNSITDYYILSK